MEPRTSFHEWLFATCDWKISSGHQRGRRFTFDAFPCQLDICRDEAHQQVVMKSAQMAISEIFTLARPFWAVDNLGVNWGVLFPSQQAMRNFFRTRIKGALTVNPYLRHQTTAENEGNITAFDHEIFLRYTTTETAIATFDADGATVDEHDFHNQDSLYGAKVSRTQGAMGDTMWYEVSTPSYPNFGIHKAYLGSDQRVWLVKCRRCGHENNLSKKIGEFEIAEIEDFFLEFLSESRFPDWRDYFIPCTGCGKALDPVSPWNRAKPSSGGGRWVPLFPNRDIHGYHLQVFQRLYTAGTPAVLRRVRQSLVDATDPIHVRRWWNFTLGLPYLSREGHLTESDLDRVTTGRFDDEWAQDWAYRTVFNIKKIKADWIGVDVRMGQYHLVEFKRINDEQWLLCGVGWVKNTTELLEYWRRRGKPVFVVDAQPDTNETRAMVRAVGRRGRRASFSKTTNVLWQPSGDPDHIIVNRPVSMEAVKSLVESTTLLVPTPAWKVGSGIIKDVGTMREEETLADHFKAPVMIRSFSETVASDVYDFPRDAMGGVDPHFFMAASLAYIASQIQAAPAFAIRIPR
jgi:hypothetical protein